MGERSSQYAAEASCRLRFGPHVDWMAQLDIDEYLVPMGEMTSLTPLLDKLDKEGFGFKGVNELLRTERRDSSGAITKGANLSDEQASKIIDFLKVKDLSELGVSIYANSITLTPGTISVETKKDKILVHYLEQNGYNDLLSGRMKKKVKNTGVS